MFAEQIQSVVDNVDGGIGGLVMGLDGIAVDSYTRSGKTLDINSLGMEFSFILGQIKKASASMEVGELGEFTVGAESLTMVIRMLSDEYFLAVALDKEANFGKCRFLMRLAQPALSKEL